MIVPEYHMIYIPIVTVGLDYALPTVNGVKIVHLGEEVAIEIICIDCGDHIVRKTDKLSEGWTTS